VNRPVWPSPGRGGGASMASVSDLNARNEEIRSALKDIEVENAGQAFDDDTKARWNDLNEELESNDKLVEELEARRARIEELSNSTRNTETEPVRGAGFN